MLLAMISSFSAERDANLILKDELKSVASGCIAGEMIYLLLT